MPSLPERRWPTRLRWRVVAVAALCLVGLVVAAAVLEDFTSGLPSRVGVPYIAPPLVPPGVVETLRLPPLSKARTPPVAVTDGDLPSLNQPLDVVQPLAGGRIVVHSMLFDSIPLDHPAVGNVPVLPDTTVEGRPYLGPPGQTWFDASRFRSRDVLVAVRQLLGGNLRLTMLGLAPGLPRLETAIVPTPPRSGARTIALATWDPPAPDLFVFDRGTARRPVTVGIYSGESRFHKRLLTVLLPLRARNPRATVFDVARIQGRTRPEILFVKRRGPLGSPEVHFLSGDVSYDAFDQHLAVTTAPIRPGEPVVVGTRVGQLTEYIVDPGRRTVSLMTLPYRAETPP